MEKIRERLRAEIADGAFGSRHGHSVCAGGYTAGGHQHVSNRGGVWLAGVHAHSQRRTAGAGSSIESVSEVIGASAITGASLHIVHINSSCGADGPECLSLVAGARARGLDVTTEAYPYVAGMTSITSALFNPGWREKYHADYGDLMLPETGERLTRERFDELHNSKQSRFIIFFSNTQPAVDAVIVHPLVMIASDGAPAHPRNAGTYSHILAEYVRAQNRITLMDALRKMSLMPAQVLERSTPAADARGACRKEQMPTSSFSIRKPFRTDRPYSKPSEPSVGVRYLLVNGVAVIEDGKMREDVFPGQAIVGPVAKP